MNLLVAAVPSQTALLTVGRGEDVTDLAPESRAAVEWAAVALAAHHLSFAEIAARPEALAGADVLWWHESASHLLPPEALEAPVLQAMQAFVQRGGGLLLSGFAPSYAVALGFQRAEPTSVLRGAGRGGHWGFAPRVAGHPLFEGLPSPFYTLAEGTETPNLLCWWDDPADFDGQWLADNEARMGKVAIGLLRADRGRVLVIGSGAFTWSDPSQGERATLERFTRQAVAWLAAPAASAEVPPDLADRDLAALWQFDSDATAALDKVSGLRDPIHNNFDRPEFAPAGRRGSALRCDGYSTWVTREAGAAPLLSDALTVQAWVAVKTYPVDLAPIANQHSEDAGWFFGVARHGQWGLRLNVDGVWHALWAPEPLPRGMWCHIAATFDRERGLVLFLNGAEVARQAVLSGRLQSAESEPLLLGRSNRTPHVAEIFPTAVFNGLIDDVAIHRRALAAGEILAWCEATGDGRPDPDLSVPPERFAHDPHRPEYHALPESDWTNEPHGFVQAPDGTFHLFYQANPNGPYWSHIHWGHMISLDLVHWAQLPPALWPGPGFDRNGVWSGDAVVDDDGRLALLYTGIDERRAVIALALSTDEAATRFERWPGNPVIDGRPRGENVMDFRDPHLYRAGPGQPWHMVIGCGVAQVGGAALHYTSDDLRRWTYRGPLLVGRRETSGIFWEMPVLEDLGGKHFFGVTETPARNSYWLGQFDGEAFAPETEAPLPLDVINHYLSPAVTRDHTGRVLAIGIIPETRSSQAQLDAGWCHLYGLPRVWGLDADGRLTQRPIPELQALRRAHVAAEDRAITAAGAELPPEVQGDVVELAIAIEPRTARRLVLAVRRSPGGEEETLLTWDLASGEVTVDRTRSSLSGEVARDIRRGPFALDPGEPVRMRVFLDRSVIEAFLNDRGTLATRVYPTRRDAVGIALRAEGGEAWLRRLDCWQMASIWEPDGVPRP